MSLSPARVRGLALGLPGAVEQDHHGFPSFRVAGRIFATLPDDGHLNVMLEEADIRAELEAHGDCCEAQRWGGRLAALRVDLSSADAERVRGWLADAWERRARR
ncbi:MAG: MmcQ/YjbR family DNA-binding protein [Planctomycetota bacterium]|nr:MmcQ/YjbR family DNA-binding protein [Planctomycetota bacterium]